MSNSRSHKNQLRSSVPNPAWSKEYIRPVVRKILDISPSDPLGPGKIKGDGTFSKPMGPDKK